MPEVHVGDDDIVFNVMNKGIYELDMTDVLMGNHPIVKIEPDTI